MALAIRYRRSFSTTALLVLLLTSLAPLTATAAQQAATIATDAALGLPAEMLPPDLGQTALRVYVEATGHTVHGQMLDYWRANGAGAVYGNPISEPFAGSNGLYSQAFERGVFQFVPDVVWTDDPTVRLMPAGQSILSERVGQFRADGRRGGGGGDRRADVWHAIAPDDALTLPQTLAEGGIYVEATGHSINGPFLDWYNAHEGNFYLGNPISEPVAERGELVQYFEGGLLMTGEEGTRLAPIVAEQAAALGIDTTAVPRGDLPLFDEEMFWTAPHPSGWALPAAGRKRIVVSISEQTLWAYQGDTLILETLVSTGLDPNDTEIGQFHVRIKKETEDMAGFTSATGEVIGHDEEELGDQDDVETYEVEDVPHVLYINYDAEALHGTFWHENFGQRMSHGCINLTLPTAAFLFGWAPLGTAVSVVE